MLSVIIPVINEEEYLKVCIESLNFIDPDEVIVVDGGSSDNTVEVAKSLGTKVVISQRGRGKQLSLGAKSAKGDYLLFLHADCKFTKPINLKKILKKGLAWGFFPIKYDITNLELKVIMSWINFRSKFFGLPYGDQGLIVNRALYQEVGGFREDYPLLEDVDLVLRLRRKEKPQVLSGDLIVSPRRLNPRLPLYPTLHSLRNFLILVAFLFGISPNILVKLYK